MARPTAPLVLTDDEKQTLTTWASRLKSTQRLVLRARIILACARGRDKKKVAVELPICAATVGTWRKRFVERRLDGLSDEPRPGAPRKIDDAVAERVVTKTLETKPKTATHWSIRGMAQAEGLSQSSVGRIWRAFGLKPNRTESFTLSTDPYCVEKVRDVVGLYMSPPERAIVLCLDEKSQIQALDRTQPMLPMTPARGSGRPTTTSATAPRIPRPPQRLPQALPLDRRCGHDPQPGQEGYRADF